MSRFENNYSVFHSIGSNDIGVIIANVCGDDANGEETDANAPFNDKMTAVFGPPHPSHSHSFLAVPLLEVQAVHYDHSVAGRHECGRRSDLCG